MITFPVRRLFDECALDMLDSYSVLWRSVVIWVCDSLILLVLNLLKLH